MTRHGGSLVDAVEVRAFCEYEVLLGTMSPDLLFCRCVAAVTHGWRSQQSRRVSSCWSSLRSAQNLAVFARPGRRSGVERLDRHTDDLKPAGHPVRCKPAQVIFGRPESAGRAVTRRAKRFRDCRQQVT